MNVTANIHKIVHRTLIKLFICQIKVHHLGWEVSTGVEIAYTYDNSLQFLYVGIPSTATLK
jgi:hypothetical protein